MDPDSPAAQPEVQPSVFQFIVGFLLVSAAWGVTTPFMRRGALNSPPIDHPSLRDPKISRAKRLFLTAFFGVFDLLRRPAYSVPFLLNITGSVWWFLLIGKAELSLSIVITTPVTFLFTVLGEYLAEGKGVGRDTWIGMALALIGLALCVHSKT